MRTALRSVNVPISNAYSLFSIAQYSLSVLHRVYCSPPLSSLLIARQHPSTLAVRVTRRYLSYTALQSTLCSGTKPFFFWNRASKIPIKSAKASSDTLTNNPPVSRPTPSLCYTHRTHAHRIVLCGIPQRDPCLPPLYSSVPFALPI